MTKGQEVIGSPFQLHGQQQTLEVNNSKIADERRIRSPVGIFEGLIPTGCGMTPNPLRNFAQIPEIQHPYRVQPTPEPHLPSAFCMALFSMMLVAELAAPCSVQPFI